MIMMMIIAVAEHVSVGQMLCEVPQMLSSLILIGVPEMNQCYIRSAYKGTEAIELRKWW